MPIRRVLTGSIIALLLCRPAGAQVRLVLENDLFSPHPLGRKAPDYDYTAGTRLSWGSAHTAWWAVHLGSVVGAGDTTGGRPRLRTLWEVGQEIYTPRIDAVEPVPGERPYAGWLYGSVTPRRRGRGGRGRSPCSSA